ACLAPEGGVVNKRWDMISIDLHGRHRVRACWGRAALVSVTDHAAPSGRGEAVPECIDRPGARPACARRSVMGRFRLTARCHAFDLEFDGDASCLLKGQCCREAFAFLRQALYVYQHDVIAARLQLDLA